MKQRGFLTALLISGWLAVSPALALVNEQNLPSLGDSTSGIISPQQEYELGQTYLKVIRSQTPTVSDPILKNYLERLLSRLAEASDLTDHRLSPLLIKNQTINAFAAPGGIVGVNTGLFLNAQTEGQFAAVLAHELAHLSQRHFARNLEEARQQRLPIAASVLASIILIAAGSANAGVAALSSSIAGFQSSHLSFSRQFEREADNIGIKTLARAGFNPNAMANVFAEMDRSSHYSHALPEFLSTHPVTENRIADARARAAQMHAVPTKHSNSYPLMQMRTIIISSDNLKALLAQLTTDLNTGRSNSPDATRYGIAITATRLGDFHIAAKQLAILLKKAPNNLYYIMAQIRLDTASNKSDIALKKVNQQLDIYLNYYPLLSLKADILSKQKHYKAARDVLLTLSRQRPQDPDIWYALAEAESQAHNILGLYQARAEYFFLNGNLNEAINYIKRAQQLAGNNDIVRAKLDAKLADMYAYRRKISQ
ncbi:MAG: M48 family metalloprotease [Endozoicomonas sp. (ex Botrylloides leachii)]|nr:M48 family metalloprotease [Endozoicomonas sp. (ex Botrylloides leachii)]